MHQTALFEVAGTGALTACRLLAARWSGRWGVPGDDCWVGEVGVEGGDGEAPGPTTAGLFAFQCN